MNYPQSGIAQTSGGPILGSQSLQQAGSPLKQPSWQLHQFCQDLESKCKTLDEAYKRLEVVGDRLFGPLPPAPEQNGATPVPQSSLAYLELVSQHMHELIMAVHAQISRIENL